MNTISLEDLEKKIEKVQKEWADSIIEIGKAYLNKKDYLFLNNKFLDKLYLFNEGKVLFKPTKAYQKQFRASKNEFISYFIGHNKVSDEDKGFALEPWKEIYFENFNTLYLEKILVTMGNYFFTNYKNEKIKVEYTFGYKFHRGNGLKIIFHHSSIPYRV